MTREDMHHLTVTLRNAARVIEDAYYSDDAAKIESAATAVRRALDDAEAKQREIV